MSKTNRKTRAVLAAALWACAAAPALAEAKAPGALEAVVDEQLASDHDSSAAQQRVADLDDETRALLQRYEQLTTEAKSMDAYSEQLAVQVASQRDEMTSSQRQLEEVEHTARDVLPMMEKMVDRLDRFVSLDVPFLLEERTKRVRGLEDILKRADVTISEKYRRIVEAYQIELDYGRTLEAYQGELTDDASPRTVQFLRIGRVALLYQTLDGKETGYWDADTRSWVVDDGYRQAVKDGFAIALKQGAPELLIAPVPAPREFPS
jgi:Protein of unknown function (DUF3450)